MPYQSDLKSPEGGDLIDRLVPIHHQWVALRADAELPEWRHWDWLQLPTDLIPWCAVVDVIDDAADFRHRFWGTARRDLFNTEYTGKLVSEMKPPAVAAKSTRELTETVRRREAIYVTTSGYDFGGQPSQYHMLRLPFGSEGQVRQVLSAVLFEHNDLRLVHQFMTEDPEQEKGPGI